MTPDSLPAETLRDIREKAEKATPGPWRRGFWGGQCHIDHQHGRGDCVYDPMFYPCDDWYQLASELPSRAVAGNYGYEEGGIIHEADSDFIAACDPQTVLRLVDELERLRGQAQRAIKAYRTVMDDVADRREAWNHAERELVG